MVPMKTKDFLGNEWEIDCMGCAVANGTMPVSGGFIQKTQYFCVHQDPLIPLPGFLVIASLRHIRSISEMQDFEYDDLSHLIKTTHHAIKEATKIEYLTIVQEESSIHFHLWFFPWTEDVIDRYGPPSLTKIRDIMADLRKRSLDAAEWGELETSLTKIKEAIEK
jgi:diadenosine tetraphosphate (Ap4A) HIT family hydrolase